MQGGLSMRPMMTTDMCNDFEIRAATGQTAGMETTTATKTKTGVVILHIIYYIQ